jgi:hypothetical protein
MLRSDCKLTTDSREGSDLGSCDPLNRELAEEKRPGWLEVGEERVEREEAEEAKEKTHNQVRPELVSGTLVLAVSVLGSAAIESGRADWSESDRAMWSFGRPPKKDLLR